MSTDAENLVEMLMSPDAANIRLALELIAQEPRQMKDRRLVLTLVLLQRLLPDKQLNAQVQVTLNSFADRRLSQALGSTLHALDYALANTNVSWIVFERAWFLYEQCREEYDELLAKNKAYLRVYEAVARYFFQRFQQTEMPIRLFKFVIENGAASELGELNYTYLLFHYSFPKNKHLEELDTAVQLLENAANHQLRQKDVLFNAAGYLYHNYRKDLSAAEKCYCRALEINPQFHEAAYHLALLYMEQTPQNPDAARVYIEQAIANSPENHTYRLLEAAIAWSDKTATQRTESLVQSMITQHARYPEVWHWAGKFYFEIQRVTEAEQAFKNGLKLNPKFIPILEGLVLLYQQKHEHDKAELYRQQLMLLSR